MIDRTDVERSAARIAGHVRHTPVLETGPGAFGVDAPLVLELEQLQHMGVFKPRGAFNRMLSGVVPAAGVICGANTDPAGLGRRR